MNQLQSIYRLGAIGIHVLLLSFVPDPCPGTNSADETSMSFLQDSIELGQRIRIESKEISPGRLVGRADSIKADTLILFVRSGSTDSYYRRIPITSITKYEVSIGRKTNTRKGTLYGLIIGSAIGGMIYMGEASGEHDCHYCGDIPPAAAVIPILGGLGCGIGALIGTISKTDRWQEIAFDKMSFHLRPMENRSVMVTVSFAF